MDTSGLLTMTVGVVLAVGGWIAAHLFATKREVEQKKREFRVKHLRDAYLKLANVCDRGNLVDDVADVQDAFNDIQLFGDPDQIALIGEIIDQVRRDGSASLNDLLNELRNEIRRHLGLSAIDSYRWYLRITKRDDALVTTA